jgi:hypothetical protein
VDLFIGTLASRAGLPGLGLSIACELGDCGDAVVDAAESVADRADTLSKVVDLANRFRDKLSSVDQLVRTGAEESFRPCAPQAHRLLAVTILHALAKLRWSRHFLAPTNSTYLGTEQASASDCMQLYQHILIAQIVPTLYMLGVTFAFRTNKLAFASLLFSLILWITVAVSILLFSLRFEHVWSLMLPGAQLTLYHLLRITLYRSWSQIPPLGKMFDVTDRTSTIRDRAFDVLFVLGANFAVAGTVLYLAQRQ